MKKVFVLFFLLMGAMLFAQPVQGPYLPSFGLGLFYSVQPSNFSGTMEIKDGYTFIRTEDRLYQLMIPKREGLIFDTVAGEGNIKLDVLGYVMLTPFNQIYVLELKIDGVDQFFLRSWPILFFPDFMKS